ncbi:YitT family protein [Evansella cellulosilytica]|uniref:YitT family protein n=1 Tax=Evansella cellulosilytica (strain ATCC 21833 / DSM 2522 / FERM P-1141 / JCM 9156 / N-4) TaxID=649639 RepID=E6U0Y6_EVAC2|nr:YitT family protein [Evansella cellulosilytica]ADU30298.1 protein of unknown function DUF161 [Evansella cellulosilytica DSM 2522]
MKMIYMVVGCFIVSLGLLLLQYSEVITGGTAGLALSFSYLTNASFALTFFLINIPFYVLSYLKMGWKFTISTIFSVATLSIMTELVQLTPYFYVHPLVGSITGGMIVGFGLCLLFLNGSSLGGANILSLFLQKRFNLDPGKTMFVFDLVVILIGLYSVGLIRGAYSILSIIMLSAVISLFKTKIANYNQEAEERVEVDASA